MKFRSLSFIQVILFCCFSSLLQGQSNSNSSSIDSLLIKKDSLEQIEETETIEFVTILQKIGGLLLKQRKAKEAESYYFDALQIIEKISGKKSREYLNILNRLGNCSRLSGKYLNAKKCFLDEKKLRSEVYNTKDKAFIRCIKDLGVINFYLGDFEQSKEYFREMILLNKNLHGEGSEEYAMSLSFIGNVYFMLSEYEEAESNWLLAKKILYNDPGENSERYAMNLVNLSNVYSRQMKFELDEKTLLDAVKIFKNIGLYEQNYINALKNLADCYQKIGDLKKAESYLFKAYKLSTTNFSEDSPEVTGVLFSLGVFYSDLGNFELSKDHYLKALDNQIKNKSFPEGSPKLLNNLGNVYRGLSDLDSAEQYYVKAKQIWEKNNDTLSSGYANVYNNLALLNVKKKNYETAERYYLKTLKLKEEKYGKNHYRYAGSLKNYGHLLRIKKEYAKAEKLIKEAIAIDKQFLGKTHQFYVKGLTRLVELYMETGNYHQGLSYLKDINDIHQELLIRSSTFLSDKELTARLKALDQSMNLVNSYLMKSDLKSSELKESAFDNTLFFKGFLLNNLKKVEQNIFAENDSLLLIDYWNWKAYKRQITDLQTKPQADRKNLKILEAKANKIEKNLVRTISEFENNIRKVTWQEVRDQLNPEEAAIEFIHFKYRSPDFTDSIFYAALITLPGNEQPSFIPLFEEQKLDRLLNKGVADEASLANIIYRRLVPGKKKQSFLQLDTLVWTPIDSLLSGVRRVYFAPDGLLHQINLPALPLSKKETIGDRYEMIQLGSMRQLVYPSKKSYTKKDALIWGGIRYDSKDDFEDSSDISVIKGIHPFNRQPNKGKMNESSRSDSLIFLEGTEREAVMIDSMFSIRGFNSTLKTGYEATEEYFKEIGESAPSPRILHIATHGFFFPDSEESQEKPSLSSDQVSVFKYSENPMIRSGLMLAGSNRAWIGQTVPEGREDGILTALEISQMNLRHTELVVLSACETGLGEVMENEGVFGLQRAFKMAGVKYLIMSLWNVEDEATEKFMTTFYGEWLSGKSIHQAFRDTKNIIRESDAGKANPTKWAGFVLVE